MVTTEPGHPEHQKVSAIEYPGFTVYRRHDSIIQVDFAEGYNITLGDARRQVEIFRQLQGSGRCVLLATFREGTTLDREVREFIASEEVSQVVKADALVIRGLALKILTNGYLKINQPTRPCRVFNNTSNALKWLHNFL